MGKAQVLTFCLAFLFAARGARAVRSPRSLPVRSGSLSTIPVRRHTEDCWKPGRKHLALEELHDAKNDEAVPGAGMTPKMYKPFASVLKDGFFEVDCAKDLLFHEGDKYGDGKFSYALGDVSNVSIVHYTELIPKEDRESMSHAVCFGFCRTIPDMHYFGIAHGRDCYCAPYYKPMAGDSSECDEVCEGKNTEFCGGEHKSSVFAMHDCQDSVENLASAIPKATEAKDALSDATEVVEDLGALMQKSGVFWQDVSGSIGQPAPSDLMQAAKVFAGELEHAAGAAKKLSLEVDVVAIDGQQILDEKKGNPSTFSEATKMEELTRSAEDLATKADDMTRSLQDFAHLASPKLTEATDAAKQYYPLTYFVDKKIEPLYTTCGGTEIKRPIVNATMDVCAKACDANVGVCVGFSYFRMGDLPSMCFLHSKFKTVKYVIACPKFLQVDALVSAKKNANIIGCYGKLSEFPSSIAPQASGKCDGCLKEADKFCAKR